jgi:CRP/FNR family transcriptional regulator, anaerobic regulatory protein
MAKAPIQRPIFEVPRYSPRASEELLTGARLLRRAFLNAPYRTLAHPTAIVAQDDPEAPVFLIQRGMAYRCCSFPDGRRAILDLLLTSDIGGIDHVVMGRSSHEIIAATDIGYRVLSAVAFRDLMADRTVALRAMALLGEARWRMDRHAAAICRLDARERIGAFLLDIHDRLRRAQLIARPTFNLPLTQEQIGDHLGLSTVHVNRVLQRMREERLVMVERQVVIIMDLDGLRSLVHGLPPLPDTAAPIAALEEVGDQ